MVFGEATRRWGAPCRRAQRAEGDGDDLRASDADLTRPALEEVVLTMDEVVELGGTRLRLDLDVWLDGPHRVRREQGRCHRGRQPRTWLIRPHREPPREICVSWATVRQYHPSRGMLGIWMAYGSSAQSMWDWSRRPGICAWYLCQWGAEERDRFCARHRLYGLLGRDA